MLMKLRKTKMKNSDSVNNQLMTVYELVSTIQWETEQMTVVNALKEGKAALEGLHKEMSVDNILDLMDEITDQTEMEQQISNAMGRGVSWGTVDEDELEEDLAALEKEMEPVKPVVEETPELNLPVAPEGGLLQMPEAPTTQLEKERSVEEEERVMEKRVAVGA